MNKAVLAAGAVLWRASDDGGEPEVAVIHRPRYDDWSLPKGKVDVGESEPMTAVREIHEETGYSSHLGRRLTSVSYPVEKQGIKKVQYWAARIVDGEFTPNDEVDELKWLPVSAAVKQLQYPHDRKVLRRFAKLPADTKSILIVRHGTAGSKSRYKGDDRLRPLDKRGRAPGRVTGRPTAGLRRRHVVCRRPRPLPADHRTVGRGAGCARFRMSRC